MHNTLSSQRHEYKIVQINIMTIVLYETLHMVRLNLI